MPTQPDSDKTSPQNSEGLEERKKQQQTDPQLTELKGFVDKNEKLEPDLEDDGTSPADKPGK